MPLAFSRCMLSGRGIRVNVFEMSQQVLPWNVLFAECGPGQVSREGNFGIQGSERREVQRLSTVRREFVGRPRNWRHEVSSTSPRNEISSNAPIIVDTDGRNEVHRYRTRIDWLIAVLKFHKKTRSLEKTRLIQLFGICSAALFAGLFFDLCFRGLEPSGPGMRSG